MTWYRNELLGIAVNSLKKQKHADDLEQVVYGFDDWKELQLHKIICSGFSETGYGVWPEQRYPAHWHKRRKNEGLRCDIVLTENCLPIKDPELAKTLFGDAVESVHAEDAYWMEIKVVKQFNKGERNHRYASELKQPVKADVIKIGQDNRLMHGGLLLVLFTCDEITGKRDISNWLQMIVKLQLSISTPETIGFPIVDRTGNGWCTVALFDVN